MAELLAQPLIPVKTYGGERQLRREQHYNLFLSVMPFGIPTVVSLERTNDIYAERSERI